MIADPTCGWSRHSFDTVVSSRDLNTSYLRQWRDAVFATSLVVSSLFLCRDTKGSISAVYIMYQMARFCQDELQTAVEKRRKQIN